MAFFFADGFDLYATMADPLAGYWDTGIGVSASNTLVAGRFTGSQAISLQGVIAALVKNSTVTTDPVHHIVCAFRQTATLTGSTLGAYVQLSDGATNQCCIVFRSDGAILLTSATPAGTVLDTYTGAVAAANTWYGFEFEVVINNSTGSWAIRKNGNTSNDHALGSLNTRPGANAQANKLTVGMQALVTAHQIDDLLWRTDATSVAWMGDLRSYPRMPAADVSVQFTKSGGALPIVQTSNTFNSDPTGTARYSPFTALWTGTVGTVNVSFNSAFTGNCKMSLFADASGAPGSVLGSATTLVNPTAGSNAFTFGTPVSVIKGTQYWVGISHDVTATLNWSNLTTTARTGTAVAYASFPSANPSTTSGQFPVGSTVYIIPVSNCDYVNEAQQDGVQGYVYDSNLNDADFYSIAPLPATPVATIAVVTRGFVEKSDAGTRSLSLQLKSGATTVQSTSTALGTNWGWQYRVDLTDPNTGSAWAPTAVNNVQIGPLVTV